LIGATLLRLLSLRFHVGIFIIVDAILKTASLLSLLTRVSKLLDLWVVNQLKQCRHQVASLYLLETSAYPREHQQLKELREASVEKYQHRSVMNVPADEAQFLSMILKMMNAKKTIEVGVFTGYSLLATALALPIDAKAGVQHKVHFIASDATSAMKEILDNGEEGTFDFAFVDADKESYIKYHDELLKLVRVGGIIGYDNTLWSGTVALADEDLSQEWKDRIGINRILLRSFNAFLASDSRIEQINDSQGSLLAGCREVDHRTPDIIFYFFFGASGTSLCIMCPIDNPIMIDLIV
ncbi:S-adenosyl-L-methionine-dependent methyltransferases superfamily protein, partial [Striga hermonthica]